MPMVVMDTYYLVLISRQTLRLGRVAVIGSQGVRQVDHLDLTVLVVALISILVTSMRIHLLAIRGKTLH